MIGSFSMSNRNFLTSFKHPRFLCYSMPSFGVSTISPKKSSLSNISPTSVITFIKGWNHHLTKNNIRYKGNANNTSVIIFLIRTQQKLPVMVLCLGEPPVRFLLLLFFVLFLYLHFIFDLHFVVVLHLSLFFIQLLFDIIPSPFRGLSLGFYNHFILSV